MSHGVEIEDVAGSSVLDLVGLNVNDDLRVDEDWNPQAYDSEGTMIEEVIPMIAVGTNAQIKAALDDLDQKLELARNWRDDKSRLDYIRLNYLEEAASQEVFRAVTNGHIVPAEMKAHNRFLENTTNRNIFRFDLELELVPGWESAEVNSSSGALDRFGGQATITNNVGSRPARMGRVIAVPTITLIGNMWLGIRDVREGLTDFTARQNAENFSLFNSSTLETGGASEYGDFVQTDFTAGGTTLKKRWTWVSFDGSPSNPEHMNGKYLLLVKANMTAGSSTVGLQARWGFGPGGQTYNTEIEVEYTSQNWHVYPLGYVQFPPWPATQNTLQNMSRFSVDFWVERLTGSAELKMDALVLMPTDHLFTMAVDANANTSPSGVDIITREDWHHFTYGVSSTPGQAQTGVAQNFQNWALPTGSSEMVLVSEILSSNAHYLPNPTVGDLTFTIYRNPVLGFPFEV